MLLENDFSHFHPKYFASLAIETRVDKNSNKRDRHPVDYNCMYLNRCKRHPEDVMFECIERDAKLGQFSTTIPFKTFELNLHDELFIPTETKVTYTKGFFWWKKEVTEIKKVDTNAGHREKLIDNTISELCRVLWNFGFNYKLNMDQRYLIISW